MKTGVSKKDNDKPQMMATPNTDSQKSIKDKRPTQILFRHYFMEIPNFIRTFVDFEYFLKTETFYVFVTIKRHTVS